MSDVETQLEELSAKTVKYVATVQPQLDKMADFNDAVMQKSAEVAAVLVSHGLIPEEKKAAFKDAIIADPLKVFDFIEKMAKLINVEDLGRGTNIAVGGRKLDAFERLALYGNPNADGIATGLIDE